jgi:hypothetical protein
MASAPAPGVATGGSAVIGQQSDGIGEIAGPETGYHGQHHRFVVETVGLPRYIAPREDPVLHVITSGFDVAVAGAGLVWIGGKAVRQLAVHLDPREII